MEFNEQPQGSMHGQPVPGGVCVAAKQVPPGAVNNDPPPHIPGSGPFPPLRRYITKSIKKKVLNMQPKHLTKHFGWHAGMGAPRMCITVQGQPLVQDGRRLQEFNKLGRDGYPCKTPWLGQLLGMLGAQEGDTLVLQHTGTAQGVMHAAASVERATVHEPPAAPVPPMPAAEAAAGAAAAQATAAGAEAPGMPAEQHEVPAQQPVRAPLPSELPGQQEQPSATANHTAGSRSDCRASSSDGRHSVDSKQQQGEADAGEVRQPGPAKKQRLESPPPQGAQTAGTQAQGAPEAPPLTKAPQQQRQQEHFAAEQPPAKPQQDKTSPVPPAPQQPHPSGHPPAQEQTQAPPVPPAPHQAQQQVSPAAQEPPAPQQQPQPFDAPSAQQQQPQPPQAASGVVLPTVGALRNRLARTSIEPATIEAYLAEWAAMAPSAQAEEWQVVKEHLKKASVADLELHLRMML